LPIDSAGFLRYCESVMTAFVVRENATFSYLRLPEKETWDSATFQRFCELNREIRAEMDAEGNVILMSPSNADAEGKVSVLLGELYAWAKQGRSVKVFGSSAGFTLPNGSVRAPDVSAVRLSDWHALRDDQKKSFAPLCPWFVMELRSSESDPLAELEAKMEEYIANGARLGWLIDPVVGRLAIYRRETKVEVLDRPAEVAGDPELAGFRFDMTPMWA